MIRHVKAPFMGANDHSAKIICWYKESGTWVAEGDVLCQLESTKALIDVVAETPGYFYTTLTVNSQVALTQLIAIISDCPLRDYRSVIERQAITAEKKIETNTQSLFSKKAEILANRHHLDINALAKELGRKVLEQDVHDHLTRTTLQPFRMGMVQRERIGIIGGVAGGGALIIIDAILRLPQFQVVAVFDQNPAYIGQHILGVPVVGAADELLQQYLTEQKIDKVVIGFNRNLQQRAETFSRLSQSGVPFCNIIDPSAEIRSQVQLGTGNIILSNVYIGPCSDIGDNNFFTAGTHIEHGNQLGSHCAFGPSVATSGNVSIGDRVRFAAGIAVEPGLTIGSDSVIASGAVIVSNVDDNHAVKLNYPQQIKVRDIQSTKVAEK